MSLVIEKFTDADLMGQVFTFVGLGGYPYFYKVFKITKKQVYLIRVKDLVSSWRNDGFYLTSTYEATNDIWYDGNDKSLTKIIKRDKIDDCNWCSSYTHSHYMGN